MKESYAPGWCGRLPLDGGLLVGGGSRAPRSLAPILPLAVVEIVLEGPPSHFVFEGHRIFVRSFIVSLRAAFVHTWRVVTGSRTRYCCVVLPGTSTLSVKGS